MNTFGYCERVGDFASAELGGVLQQLKHFVSDADESQIRAWRDSIAILQTSALHLKGFVDNASIILEYTIPLESRRIDAVLLVSGLVLVLEFKGKLYASQADIDQAAAYARDLRAYHRECAEFPVRSVLVLTRFEGQRTQHGEVDVIGPHELADYIAENINQDLPTLDVARFIAHDAYQPLPTLIKAARELFSSGSLTRIHRAAMATEPTLAECTDIVHRTAKAKRRALILICGVPGAGKTLVGLQLAHAKFLDDLSVVRENGEKPTAAAVFLSGNGPLVEVLQYELRSAGGDGKAFVRGVHDYVKTYTSRANSIPPQHVLIYDEAQRAFDAAQVQAKHQQLAPEFHGLSEPELFIQFAERVPEWCVVVGLIGSGQEIHIGEEAGLGQWRSAIEKVGTPEQWDIYLPSTPEVQVHFTGMPRAFTRDSLQLSVTIRFHLATRLYEFVKAVLDGDAETAYSISDDLEDCGYNLRLTHDLEVAKSYLRDRYYGYPEARYGMVASSKDKDLANYGIPKGFKSPGEVGPGKYGKWYSESLQGVGSCMQLNTVATEFGSQGLELDACLLAWGSDFIREHGEWTNRFASGYREMNRIVDAKALRMNAYRVLLTRGRDCCVVYVPPISDKMRETFSFLRKCGFTELKT